MTAVGADGDDGGPKPDAALLEHREPEKEWTIEDTESSPRAWIIVALVFVGLTVVYGMTTCVGVFHVVFLEEFRENSAVTSWIGALNTGFSMFSATVCGILTRWFPCRTLIMIGLLICTVGLFTSAFAHSVIFLYLSYGILTGIGVGFTFMGMCTCITQTFQRRLPLASGIATSAFGLSTFLYPSLIKLCEDQYGWRDTFIILASMIIQFAVAACFIQPIVKPNLNGAQDTFKLSLFKEIRFVLYLTVLFFMNIGVSVIFVHLETYVTSGGYPIGKWLIPLFGLTNCIGRVGFGALGTLSWVDPARTMLLANLICGITVCLLPICRSDVTIMSCVAAYGMLNGANGYTAFALMQRYFGQELISTAYGYAMSAAGCGLLAGAPLAGFVFDSTHTYSLSMYLGGGVTILSSVFQLPEAFGPLRPSKLRVIQSEEEKDEIT